MVQAVICDIEGTLGSISFVRDTLFPYARARLEDFIHEHQRRPDVARELQATASLAKLEPDDLHGQIIQLIAWIEADVKATPLKALQGMIWLSGYQSGAYTAHLYEDAARALKAWHADGFKLYVYSSGSVAAQKLFFQYSDFGDLRPLFTGYFDTTTGGKAEASSYRAIANSIGLATTELLFLSDVESELEAARQAGLATTWVLREQDWPGLKPAFDCPHPIVGKLSEVCL